jgi:hypothetical protein
LQLKLLILYHIKIVGYKTAFETPGITVEVLRGFMAPLDRLIKIHLLINDRKFIGIFAGFAAETH